MRIQLFVLGLVLLTACGGPEYTVTPGPRPFKGNPDAKILVQEYSDFECPACGIAAPRVAEIIKKYNDKVRFEYKHFPLVGVHTRALAAAEAAECANDQGKFWEYHDILFSHQQNLETEDFKKYATDLNLNREQFDLCLDSHGRYTQVRDDLAAGAALDINATPSFVVNGVVVYFENLETQIKSNLGPVAQ